MPHFCEIIKAKICFPRQQKYVPLEEIIMLEGMVNYTIFHLLSGRKLLIPKTLKLFEFISGNYDFLRTHRNFIIDCEHLQSIDNEGLLIRMSNNLLATVSRRRRGIVNKKITFSSINHL